MKDIFNDKNKPESEKHELFLNHKNINGKKYVFSQTGKNKYRMSYSYKKVITEDFDRSIDYLKCNDEYLLLHPYGKSVYYIDMGDFKMKKIDCSPLKNIDISYEVFTFIDKLDDSVYVDGRRASRYDIKHILGKENKDIEVILYVSKSNEGYAFISMGKCKYALADETTMAFILLCDDI